MKTRYNREKGMKECEIAVNGKDVIFSDYSTLPFLLRDPSGSADQCALNYNPIVINKIKSRALDHVIVWRAFSSNGYVQIMRMEGNLNRQGYIAIRNAAYCVTSTNYCPKQGFTGL